MQCKGNSSAKVVPRSNEKTMGKGAREEDSSPPGSFSLLTFHSTKNERRLRLQRSAENPVLDPHATDLTNDPKCFLKFSPT